MSHDSTPDNDLLDWEGLTLPLPVTFEQEGENGVSVSLGDLVRHMHPYCMAIRVENDKGEQMLPEGGIILEVVDQGENGEPILAIPQMDLPVSLPLMEQSSENEQKVSDEAASDSSEHIVVDDEDVTVSKTSMKGAAPVTPDLCSDIKDEMTNKRQKEEIKEKSPSKRKKKKKCKEECQHKPLEGRVLRSGTVRNTVQELPKKSEKRSIKEEKKHKLPEVSPASAPASSEKPKKLSPNQTETQAELTSATLSSETNMQVATSVSPSQKTTPLQSQPSCSPTAVTSQQLDEMPKQLAPAPEKLEDSSVTPSAVLPMVSSEGTAAVPSPVTPEMTPPVVEALPPVAPVAPVVSEPKPKSLSLAEYRRLRQQKKPTPVESQGNSTKWPSLPELPKELPPIPCLPDPSPKDPRRPNPQAAKKEVEEVRPAWQPRGPCAPPTPEALLVPPAYMVASSSKVSTATSLPKPQQQTSRTPEPSKPSLPEKLSTPATNLVQNLPTHQHPKAPCEPQSSGSPASLKPDTQLADRKCSPALSEGKSGVGDGPQSQLVSPKSEVPHQTSPKTTTEALKPTVATIPSAPQNIVYRKVPEVAASTLLDDSITSDGKSSKATANGTRVADPQSLKTEPVVLETKEKPTTAVKLQRAKSPTRELIEAFTSEIGKL